MANSSHYHWTVYFCLSPWREWQPSESPPVGLHPSQGDKQKKLFPAGTASYLWIHQVQSRSDWAAVRRSRWRIHRATIERFIFVYRLEENGSLLKEGTGDAVGWTLRACSYKTKTEASQQRRSRHTLQGVFLFLPLFLFITLSLRLFVSLSLRLLVSSSLSLFVSLSLCIFVSLSLRLTRQLMGINGETFLTGSAPFWNSCVTLQWH